MFKLVLNAAERKAAYGVAGILALRTLGLFIMLPVFSLYAIEYPPHAMPWLVGAALGIYGLTAAISQMGLGWLTDRMNRKGVMIIALALFTVGSFIGGHAHSIDGLFWGRLIQGFGVVGSAAFALLTDVTRDEVRLRGVSIAGLSIGVSFAAAVFLGPFLSEHIGLPGLFYLSALLGVAAMIIVAVVLPNNVPIKVRSAHNFVPAHFKRVLRQKSYRPFYIGVFMLHAILIATFVALPLSMTLSANISVGMAWLIYLPAVIVGFFIALLLIGQAESKRRLRGFYLGAVLALIVVEFFFYSTTQSSFGLALSVVAFLALFVFLESALPSMLSKQVAVGDKGTALTLYHTCQYLGASVGGVCAGWVFGLQHYREVYLIAFVAAIIWLLTIGGMTKLNYTSSFTLDVGQLSPDQADALASKIKAVTGVTDVLVVIEESAAYVKFDSKVVDFNALMQFSHNKSLFEQE